MKNTMKKLLCMALAIMLLVSAVPVFAAAEGEVPDTGASAQAEPATLKVPVQVYIDGVPTGGTKYITLTEGGENAVLNAETGMAMLKVTENREFVKWVGSNGHEFTSDELGYEFAVQNAPYSLELHLHAVNESAKPTEPAPTTPAPTEPAPTTPVTPLTFTVTVNANGGTFNGSTSKQFKVTQNGSISLDSATVGTPTRSGCQFAGWYTDSIGGSYVDSLTNVTSDVTVYAHWSKLNEVSVYAVYYHNGLYKGTEHLVTLTSYSGKNLYNFLNTSENRAIIASKIPTGYTWGHTSSDDDDYFYTYDNEGKLTAQNELANASKSVCIRIYSDDTITAGKVLLYVHTSVGGTATVYDMKDYGFGYAVGDQVTVSHVKAVLDKKYSYTSFAGLYDDTAWKQLCAGKSPTDAYGVTVTSTDGVSVHVVLKNSTTKSSSTADSSNPKTGDTIFAPIMVMGLTGTVLAAAYVIGKKRFAR